jgi:hypothetical protein
MARLKKQRKREKRPRKALSKAQRDEEKRILENQRAGFEFIIDSCFGVAKRVYDTVSKPKASPAPPLEKKQEEPPERKMGDLPAWARY